MKTNITYTALFTTYLVQWEVRATVRSQELQFPGLSVFLHL